jgi:HK97 family phage major capsid protein
MSKKLTKLLEYYTADDYVRKKIAETASFNELIKDVPKERKELLLSNELEGSHVLQEEVLKTILEGAKDFRCMREAFPMERTNTSAVRVVYQPDKPGRAVEVPEGGKIPINYDVLDSKTIKIKKYGDRPLISKEIIEDALWDRVSIELKRLGFRMENALNDECMKEMLSGSPNSVNATSGGIIPKDVSDTIRDIKKKRFLANAFILHPQSEGELRISDNLLKYHSAGDAQALREGSIGKLFGLNAFIYSIDNDDETLNWGSEIGDAYAWIGDANEFLKIIMRRELQVEKYDDPVYDLVGLSATMRFGVGKIQENSGQFIKKYG